MVVYGVEIVWVKGGRVIFAIAGMAICVGSILLFMGEFAAQNGKLPSWDDAHEPQNKALYRQSLWAAAFGIILLLMGITDLGIGSSFWQVSGKECFSMSILSLSVNCQARLVVFGLRQQRKAKTGETLLSTLRSALSVGWFPRGNGYVSFVISTTQGLALAFLLIWIWSLN